jgi:O-antigen ligase
MAEASGSTVAEAGHVGRPGIVLRWIGAVGICLIAVMRCVTGFAPQVVFDFDPASTPLPFAGLGPAGSLWLDVALLVACACGLAGVSLGRRGLDWALVVLAFAPTPLVWWHARDSLEGWRVGATWASAAIACATIAHLARERGIRIVVVTLLLAVIAPLLLRGAANVTYEYQDTVAQFDEQRSQILLDKGWQEDSPQAQIFERRLRQREPTGWFLTTNIYGSLMAFGMVAMLGLAISARRARLDSGWIGLFSLAALLSAAGLLATRSKGAILVGVFGVLVLLAPIVVARARRWLQRFGPAVAVAAIVLALGGVVMRGVTLPEGFLGEKSLLFRWHYMQASASIIAEHPLLGVGPGGYQVAYTIHRVPRNPEEVASAHSVFWDWLCALGVTGAAWAALAIVLLWRAGGALRDQDDSQVNETAPDQPRGPPIAGRAVLFSAAIVAALGLGAGVLIESNALDGLGLFVRLIGVGGYMVLALSIGRVLADGDQTIATWALATGAIVLVVHGQIEMTFVQPGSVVWAMCLLGVAGGARAGAAGPAGVGWIAALAALGAAAGLAVAAAMPATRQQSIELDAAARLWPIAEARSAVRTLVGANDAATREDVASDLVAALRSLGIEHDEMNELGLDERFDSTFDLSRRAMGLIDRRLMEAERERRVEAADLLVEAHEVREWSPSPLLAAASQLERASRLERGEARVALLERAAEVILPAAARADGSSALSLSTGLRWKLAQVSGDESHLEIAIEQARELARRDPHSPFVWKRLGNLLWASGRRTEAAGAYARALEADANFALDDLKRLLELEREILRRRIRETTAP